MANLWAIDLLNYILPVRHNLSPKSVKFLVFFFQYILDRVSCNMKQMFSTTLPIISWVFGEKRVIASSRCAPGIVIGMMSLRSSRFTLVITPLKKIPVLHVCRWICDSFLKRRSTIHETSYRRVIYHAWLQTFLLQKVCKIAMLNFREAFSYIIGQYWNLIIVWTDSMTRGSKRPKQSLLNTLPPPPSTTNNNNIEHIPKISWKWYANFIFVKILSVKKNDILIFCQYQCICTIWSKSNWSFSIYRMETKFWHQSRVITMLQIFENRLVIIPS